MFGTELPIILAPMAGFGTVELAIAAASAGALGSLACASIAIAEAERQIAAFRACGKPLALNFFCHPNPIGDDAPWREKLAPYYAEFAIDSSPSGTPRNPFDAAACALVERSKPEVVSFHFGLPPGDLLARVKAIGARVISSATTVREAVWLAERGCDAIIAQGAEAGGHRAMFLSVTPEAVASQVGTFALVPQIADAVRVPVIAAGGIGDARGIVAALALGASAVQLGTAYLACPEAKVSPWHRRALADARDDSTVITNVFSGRPARGIVNRAIRELGPISDIAPPFPLASAALAPVRASAEAAGSGEFSNLWAGQAAHLARPGEPAYELTRRLWREAEQLRGTQAIPGAPRASS